MTKTPVIKTTDIFAVIAIAAIFILACSGVSVETKTMTKSSQLRDAPFPGGRLAVVSVNVHNFSGDIAASPMNNVPDHVRVAVNDVLRRTEKKLSKHFEVVPAKSFVGTEAYRAGSVDGPVFNTFVPVVGGKEMLNYTVDRDAFEDGKMPVEVISKLASALDVDYIALVHVEWGSGIVKVFEAEGELPIEDLKGQPMKHKTSVYQAVTTAKSRLTIYRGRGEVVFSRVATGTGGHRLMHQRYDVVEGPVEDFGDWGGAYDSALWLQVANMLDSSNKIDTPMIKEASGGRVK